MLRCMFHPNRSLAVGIARVTQSWRVVSVEDGVYSEDVIAFGVVEVPFVVDVVEFGQFFGEDAFVLALLQHILLLIPQPRRINLSKILHNQSFLTNIPLTKDSQSLRMHSKMRIILTKTLIRLPQTHIHSIKDYFSQFPVLLRKSMGNTLILELWRVDDAV